MADVVVIGAGVGGMAVAARLAKQGHLVTVFERHSRPGGRLRSIERDGFRWDAGQSSTTLPAVLRDLFRSTGRPIERYLELELRNPTRRHVFDDDAVVELPTGSRADQIRAVDTGLGAGAGPAWAEFVDGQADVWDVLRRSNAGPDGPSSTESTSHHDSTRRRLRGGSVARLLRRGGLRDERLRAMVGYRFVMAGYALREVPAYAAVAAYVERSFGVWTSPGGLSGLTDALVTRLAEREVQVHVRAPVARIRLGSDGVIGVELDDGTVRPADVVVSAIDPLTTFSELVGRPGVRAARSFASTPGIDPPALTHLGLRGETAPGTAVEVVLHGDPLIVVHTGATAPPGHRTLTVERRGQTGGDVLDLLATRGLDLRGDVVVRVDRSPIEIRSELLGAAYPGKWTSPREQRRRRSAYASPVPGLHVLAASLTPDASIPAVAWTAAQVAARIGGA